MCTQYSKVAPSRSVCQRVTRMCKFPGRIAKVSSQELLVLPQKGAQPQRTPTLVKSVVLDQWEVDAPNLVNCSFCQETPRLDCQRLKIRDARTTRAILSSRNARTNFTARSFCEPSFSPDANLPSSSYGMTETRSTENHVILGRPKLLDVPKKN